MKCARNGPQLAASIGGRRHRRAVPDSGVYAALGYSEEAAHPYEMAFIRNHYVGRSFLQPSQTHP